MTAPLTLRDDLREFERLLSALIDADRESELLGAAPGCSPAEAEVARKKWLDAHGALLAEVRELRAPPEASPATARELGSDLCVECKHPIHWHAPSRPGCKGPKPCACGLTRGEAHGRAAAPAPASPAAPRGEPLDAILARCQTVGERAMALTAWDAARASPAPRAPADATRKEE